MNRHFWTADQIAALVARYPHEPTAAIARDLGRSISATYGKADLLGLKKSADYLAGPHACRLRRDDNPGIQSRFRAGQTPWNKGAAFNPGGRSAETRFKPGATPPNVRPVGYIRTNSEGYLDIKVAPGPRQWVPLHRWNWKQAHGDYPPPGWVVSFIDGDKHNCDIGNLKLISRVSNMSRNSVHALPKEVAELVQLRAALMRKIRTAEKRLSQEESTA